MQVELILPEHYNALCPPVMDANLYSLEMADIRAEQLNEPDDE